MHGPWLADTCFVSPQQRWPLTAGYEMLEPRNSVLAGFGGWCAKTFEVTGLFRLDRDPQCLVAAQSPAFVIHGIDHV